uniref:Uncharacterized protein n=1 Tax=Rhizophora mucronata TaxID=61149 RepID=A0A2P2QQW5_RHIMU
MNLQHQCSYIYLICELQQTCCKLIVVLPSSSF